MSVNKGNELPPVKKGNITIQSNIKIQKNAPSESKQSTADILIVVDGFENLKGKYPVTDVFVQAEFMGIVIGESPQQSLTHDDFIKHNFHCRLRYYPNNLQCVHDLIGNPLVFNVYQIEGVYDTTAIENDESLEEIKVSQTIIQSIEKMKIEKKQDNKKSTKTLKVDDKKETPGPEIVGRCNIDLLPLVMGEEYIKESVTLQQEDLKMDDSMIPCNCLPKIRVYLEAPEPILSEEERQNGNIIEFSIESIYNIAPKPMMFEDMYYKFGVLLPITSEQLVPIVIDDGIVQTHEDIEKAKKWPGLVALENRASYTNYYFDRDYLSIKNTLNIDLKNILETSPKRIEWNIMKRYWLRNDSTAILCEKLKKFRKWPIEIYGTKKLIKQELLIPDSDANVPIITPSKPDPIPLVDRTRGDIHLMGFLDITKLLYPGVKSTRVACQLNTFVANEITANTGIEEIIFKDAPTSRPQSAKKKESSSPGTNVNVDEIEKSIPLVDDNKMPTFIIVNVEFLKPLYPKRSEEILLKELHTLIPQRTVPTSNLLQEIEDAEKDVDNCIESISDELNHQYNLFMKAKKKSRECYGDRQIGNFQHFLEDNGVNVLIANMLKAKIYKLASKRFPTAAKNINSIPEYDEYINALYAYFRERINGVVNSRVTTDINLRRPKLKSVNNDLARNILYYAREATENDKIGLAKRYYLENISYDEENPDAWFRYAIFNLRISKFDEAHECCRKCTHLNLYHKYGLLLLAIMLFRRKIKHQAEICFQILICKYQKFYLGLMVFHLFYLATNDYKGADIMYENARKCRRDQSGEVSNDMKFENEDELVWNVKLWAEDELYAETAVFLLKLNCFELAHMALAQNLIAYPDTKCYTYYYAVGFYLQGKYKEAIPYLEDALKIYGHDANVGSLLAHCHYKLNDIKQALEYYEPIINMIDRQNNILICYTNVAMIYKLLRKPMEALKIILLACRYTPTANIWLLAGMIYCDLDDLENAEVCLNESNALDNKLNETWKCLADINRKIGNDDVADICLLYVIDDNLAPLSVEIKPQSFVSSTSKDDCTND